MSAPHPTRSKPVPTGYADVVYFGGRGGLDDESFEQIMLPVRASHKLAQTAHERTRLFREQQTKRLTNLPGCYVLCDARGEPLYVGGGKMGIRTRAQRHLTSARSDIIASGLVGTDEIAFVVAYVCQDPKRLDDLEAWLYTRLAPPLNQRALAVVHDRPPGVSEPILVQMLPDDLIAEAQHPENYTRMLLTRSATLLDYLVTTKRTAGLRRTLSVLLDRFGTAFNDF